MICGERLCKGEFVGLKLRGYLIIYNFVFITTLTFLGSLPFSRDLLGLSATR